MGEVYRARDSKLKRDVALKVLPAAFANDAERMPRFQREAQVLASLNHPNIAAIHGLEESSGVRALVMELVEGSTLAERIAQGPIPLEEALPMARQIAEGLEYAHEKGIVHRDLKPGNVKITPEATVKVLDFGLAKALETPLSPGSSPEGRRSPEGPGEGLDSPTLISAATQAGVILGTAAYMSPEQAKGKAADKRGDIWAFGCVLYEMLTGQRVFKGETVTETLAAVLRVEPEWNALPASTPAAIRRLLQRCLEKDLKRRLQAIGEARFTIDETLSGTTEAGAVHEAPPHKSWMRALPWALAAISTLVLLVLAIGDALRPTLPPTRPIARVVVTLPLADRLALGSTPVLTLSPDGSRLVYVANRGGSTQLYLRPLDRFEATPILGTEGAESPFFSPNGQSVGFFAEGKLKRVSFSGGAPLTLCGASLNRGASWGPDGTIVFTPAAATSGLFEVSAAGGTPKALTMPARKKGDLSHRWPEILPGGKAVLFTIWSGGSFADARIALLSLETGEQRVLVEGGTYARYVLSGHLVFARADGLVSVPFDLKRLKVTGPPVSMVGSVSASPLSGAVQVSFSGDGSLAYVAGGPSVGERTLLWVDRQGAARPIPMPPRVYTCPRLSPEGERLAIGIQGANPGLWLYEFARDTLTRLVASPMTSFPTWTGDGKHVTFAGSGLGSPYNLFWMSADGSGTFEPLTTSENMQFPGSWSPDGHLLAFSEADPTTGWHIWMLSPKGEPKARLFSQTAANEGGAIFSPDGRWLAYESDEPGRHEIYVRPFPGPGGKVQISTEGGTEPVWSRNGRELFYRNGDKMMAAAIVTQPAFAPAKPRLLFEGHYETGLYPFLANYDVSPDGQRFLMIKASDQGSTPTQFNVVFNWSEELRRLAPAGKP
jgi:serine/threonine-protein kinase